MGVNIDRIVMLTFLIGGAMAGIGGMLYVIFFEVTTFSVGLNDSRSSFACACVASVRWAVLCTFRLSPLRAGG